MLMGVYEAALPVSGAVWTPASLPNLLAWYKADTGVSTSGGNITAVTDQSGNGHNLSAVGNVAWSATSYPGSKPGWTYSGAGALYSSAISIGTFANCSCFTAMSHASNGGNIGLIVYGMPGTSDYLDSSAGLPLQGAYPDSYFASKTGLGNTSNTAALTVGNSYRLGSIMDNGGNALTLYVNNVAQSGPAAGTSSYGNGGTFVFGGRWFTGAVDYTSNPSVGTVAEIVITTGALSSTDRNNLDTYFTTTRGF